MAALTEIARHFDTHFGFGKETTRGTEVSLDTYIPCKDIKPNWERERIDTQGSDGDAQQEITDNVAGIETPGFNVRFPFRPHADYEELLEGIMGGTPTGSGTLTYPVANTLPGFTVEARIGSSYYKGAGFICAEAEFSSEANGALMLSLTMMGATIAHALSGGTNSVDLTKRAFIHTDVVVTVAGTGYPISAFKWGITRNAAPWHANSVQPNTVVEKRAMPIAGEFEMLMSKESKDIFLNFPSDTTVAIVATYTSGSDVLTFTFNDCKLLIDPAGMSDVDVDLQRIGFEAMRDDTAGTDAVVCTMTDV